MSIGVVIVKVIIDVQLGHPVQVVTDMICEVFGKEEMKENPRAKLVLIEVEEIG